MKVGKKGKISILTDKDYQDYLDKLTTGQKVEIIEENKD